MARARPASGVVVSAFGPRVAPKAGASTFHRGLDIIGSGNAAPEDGVVIAWAYRGAFGWRLDFAGDSGAVHWLAHCKKGGLRVPVGTRVSTGTVLAALGASGNVTGPHVHWEVHPGGGTAIDPATWLGRESTGFRGDQIVDNRQEETGDMIHYMCVQTSTNGMIGKNQRFVQGPDGVLRCLSAEEWPVISHNFPDVRPAEWSGDMVVNLIALVGLREYESDPAAPGGVGRLTGRIIFAAGERDFPTVRLDG